MKARKQVMSGLLGSNREVEGSHKRVEGRCSISFCRVHHRRKRYVDQKLGLHALDHVAGCTVSLSTLFLSRFRTVLLS